MENKVLILAGMHRSGTSLVCQWLHKCGLNVGEEVLGPSIGNDDGHFEDLDFLSFHINVLKEQELPIHGLIDKIPSELEEETLEKLKVIITSKNKANVQWSWKDPRTCLFLPVYRELLPNAKYLVIVRSVEASVSSLIYRLFKNADIKKRNVADAFLWKTIRGRIRKRKLFEKLTEDYVKVWNTYNEAILEHINNSPKSSYKVIDFTMLKDEDKSLYEHLENRWNFHLNYIDFNSVYKKELINKATDIRLFIKNKEVLNKAKKLEESLRSLI